MDFSDRSNINQFLDELSRTTLLAVTEEIAYGSAVVMLKSTFVSIDVAGFASFLRAITLAIATLPMKTPRNIFV